MKKQQVSDHTKSIYLDTHAKINIRRRVNTQSTNKNILSTSQQTQQDQMKFKYSTNNSKSKIKNPRKNKYYTDLNESQINLKDQQQTHKNIKNTSVNADKDKDLILQKLYMKNNLLKQQIYRVQRFQQQQTKKNNKKQYNASQIYYASSTKQSLMQQLANAYQKIRRMQTQINQMQKTQIVDHVKILENLKKRAQQVDLLKNNTLNKLQKLKKLNKSTDEKIDKHRNQGGYKQTMAKLTLQLDELKDKQKQMIANEAKKKQKRLKQQEYIRRLQVQLMENGMSKQSVQDLMNRVVYGDNTKKPTQPIQHTRQQTLLKMQTQYKKITSEMTILKKSVKQQQKLLEEYISIQKEASEKERNTRNLSKQLDEEIKKIQQQIIQARKMINPVNLKPKLPPKEPSLQHKRQQHKQHLKEIRRKFYSKKTKKYLQSLQNIDKQVNQFASNEDLTKSNNSRKLSDVKIYEVAEEINVSQLQQPDQKLFGKIDQNGIKFSDKQISLQLGQQQCKITSLSVLNSQNKIVGIQAKYNYITPGRLHQYTNLPSRRQNDKNFISQRISQEFQCVQQEFVTSITGKFSSKSILLNLTLLTNLNRYYKFGSGISQEGDNEQQFEICNDANCYPSYIVGCVNRMGICQFGAKIAKQQSSQQQNEQF